MDNQKDDHIKVTSYIIDVNNILKPDGTRKYLGTNYKGIESWKNIAKKDDVNNINEINWKYPISNNPHKVYYKSIL